MEAITKRSPEEVISLWMKTASSATGLPAHRKPPSTDFPVEYDKENARLTYQNGVRTDTVYESETKSSSTVIYEDGTGYFEIDGNKLIWYNDKEEGGPSTFIKDEGAVNP